MLNLDYLVTGTGRCGSVYMARLLTSLGIPCSHEAIFNFKGLDWAKKVINGDEILENSFCSKYDLLQNKPIENWLNTNNVKAESSYMAAPYINDPMLANTKVIHVVRNPMKVISSHTKDIDFFESGATEAWLNFVLSHMPEIRTIQNKIEKACYFYVYWNKMIKTKAANADYLLHQVEKGCDQNLLDFLGVQNQSSIFTDTTINSWKKRSEDLTIQDIPNGAIKDEFLELMNQYNYKIKKSMI